MSLHGLARFGNLSKNNLSFSLCQIKHFSRKSNSKGGSYKTVPRRAAKENNRSKLASVDPSIELLAPTNGFPFFLPGNVGIGWYDTHTSLHVSQNFMIEQVHDETAQIEGDIICRVQVCPTVLRKTVCDLFPYRNLETCDLSVVTISLKPNMKSLRKNQEVETERLAQTFVITAKIVCDKLRKNGYWADFINPFSGLPYLFPSFNNKTLYEADPKFRCLDFQIFDIKTCRIVSNEEDKSKRQFCGSLFTNAPSKKDHISNIFTTS